MKRIFAYLAATLMIMNQASAQNNRSFTVDAPSVVLSGETFQVKYILKNPKSRNPRFVPPAEVNGLTYYGSSSYTSSQSSATIINGKLKVVSTRIHTWILTFSADKPGTYTLSGAKVDDDGDVLVATPVTVKVEKNPNNNLPKAKKNPEISDNVNVPQESDKLFVKLTASKTTAYLGEPVFIQARLYSRYRLSIQDMKPGTFDGFWKQEIDMPTNITAEEVMIGGKKYLAATLDKQLIFPQKTGKLKITPYELSCMLYDVWNFPLGEKTVKSNSLVINVKPLPQQGKPADFSGAVGRFSLSVEPSSTSVAVDEPVTIKIVISGTGNFGLFDAPEPQVPMSFEKLEPKNIPSYNPAVNGLTGKLTLEYIYIPRSGGEFTVPPVVFTYFDPKTGKYKTLKSKPIVFTVSGNADTTAVYGSAYKTDVTRLGSDINYIFTNNFKLSPKNKFYACSTEHWLSYLFIILLGAVAIIITDKNVKLRADLESFRAKKASKNSIRRLRKAKKYMQENNKEKFFEEVADAMWNYLSDKLSIPVAELTRETAREKLQESGVHPDLIDRYIKVIDSCEFARYAPSQTDLQMKDIYKQALNLITEIEQNA